MPYITPEDMKPGMKLLMTDVAEFIGYAVGEDRENILYPHATDNRLGPRARQCEVLEATAGMSDEFGDEICFMVTLKVPGRKHPVRVPMGADWMVRQPLSTTY